jgi:hypothetical protein
MIKAGIVFVLAIAVLGLAGPTVAATGEYLVGPRQLSCSDYSVKVPLRWKPSLKRCDGEILLERRSNLLFDSESGGDSIFIWSSRNRRTITSDRDEGEFRKAYPEKTASPLRVSDVFNRCLRVDLEPDGSWISVECTDASNRVGFNFFGPERRLNDAVSLIEIR